jgi:hypothetical protein
MCLVAFLLRANIQYHEFSTRLLVQNPVVEPIRRPVVLIRNGGHQAM